MRTGQHFDRLMHRTFKLDRSDVAKAVIEYVKAHGQLTGLPAGEHGKESWNVVFDADGIYLIGETLAEVRQRFTSGTGLAEASQAEVRSTP